MSGHGKFTPYVHILSDESFAKPHGAKSNIIIRYACGIQQIRFGKAGTGCKKRENEAAGNRQLRHAALVIGADASSS